MVILLGRDHSFKKRKKKFKFKEKKMPLLKKCKKFFVSFDFPELSCDVFSPVLSVPHTQLPLAPPPADQFPALARLPLLLTAQHNADFGEKNKSQLFHGDGSSMLF